MTQPSLSERRQAIIGHAHKIGINDDYIDLLVESFYQRIREHPILGPIFNDAIGDNWPHHLAQMKNFWASVTMNMGRYSGQPVPAHKKHLGSIQKWHFSIWLGLFGQTLDETGATPEAKDYFMERAERIAESLQLALFGLPSLQTKPSLN